MRFPQETLPEIPVGGKRLVKGLQRHEDLQIAMPGKVNGAHATRRDPQLDHVIAYRLAAGEARLFFAHLRLFLLGDRAAAESFGCAFDFSGDANN